MKNLLLSLALILSANAWADDEFPIELTCEFGSQIIFFHLNETKENSWFMLDKFNASEFPFKSMRGKKIFFKRKYKIEEHQIKITIGTSTFNEQPHVINRYTLGMSRILGGQNHNGQCYKGFKEYEKQI